MPSIIIETAEGSQTIIQPTVAPHIIQVSTQPIEVYSRTQKIIDDTVDAILNDDKKWLAIDASVADVNYNINPALFTGLTFYIRVKDATFVPTVSADSGTIQLINGDDQTSVQLVNRQPIKLYSDGTNLIEV